MSPRKMMAGMSFMRAGSRLRSRKVTCREGVNYHADGASSIIRGIWNCEPGGRPSRSADELSMCPLSRLRCSGYGHSRGSGFCLPGGSGLEVFGGRSEAVGTAGTGLVNRRPIELADDHRNSAGIGGQRIALTALRARSSASALRRMATSSLRSLRGVDLTSATPLRQEDLSDLGANLIQVLEGPIPRPGISLRWAAELLGRRPWS